MPKRKTSNKTERIGVNFVRSIIEGENCVFKEIHREHDYGHDAFVLLVENEEVLPNELALQIKSGKSYCSKNACKIAATKSQLDFWRQHPFETLGIVYDPSERRGYWIDLKAEAKRLHRMDAKDSASIQFPKTLWNRFDKKTFRPILFQVLLGRAPILSIETATKWALSNDADLHQIGCRVLFARHRANTAAWRTFFDIFSKRNPEDIYPLIIYYMAHVPWHFDLGTSIPEIIREYGLDRIKKFNEADILKLLSFVDENGFERGSIGQNVIAIVSKIENWKEHLKSISTNASHDVSTTSLAKAIVRGF